MSIREAFFGVCDKAEPAKARFVSLYAEIPFYGGPEEGGWWGRDVELVASQRCVTDDEAEAIRLAVVKLANELSEDARDAFNRGCAAEMEWLEARGLDADFLPEVDGEESYFVAVEDRAGSLAYQGERHYS